MEPLVSRVQHLQINFHDLKNDFLAMVEVVQRLIAENKKQKEASDEVLCGCNLWWKNFLHSILFFICLAKNWSRKPEGIVRKSIM